MFSLARNGLNWIMQAGYSTALLFSKNELSSHASAAAYYFLLALAPMILVVVSLLNTSLINYPELTADLFAYLSQFNAQLNEDFFRRIGILQAQSAVSGLGLLGFLWTSRLIISSMQSAFGVIFPSSRSRNFFWSNVLSMVLVPGVLTLLLLSAVFNIVIRFLHRQVEQFTWLERLYELLFSLSGLILPVALVFGLIFICYRFLPLTRPKTWHAALGAGLCTLSIFGLKTAFVQFVSLTRYHVVYGSLGAVIFMLLWVYLVFLVFFLFAQFVHVAGRIDIIALDKIIAPRGQSGGFRQRLEERLFGRSDRVLARYARRAGKGESIYKRGDRDTEIYFLLQGRIALINDQDRGSVEQPASVIEPGQVFGEMSYLLGEPRMYTARAEGEVMLLNISPQAFESLLEQSPDVARKIIASMGRRLRQAVQEMEKQEVSP